jgi:hypothetical protein
MAYSIYDYTSTYEFKDRECTIYESTTGETTKRYYYIVKGKTYEPNYETNTVQVELTVEFHLTKRERSGNSFVTRDYILDTYNTELDDRDRKWDVDLIINIPTTNNQFGSTSFNYGQAIYRTEPFDINIKDLLTETQTISVDVNATLILNNAIIGSKRLSFQERIGSLISPTDFMKISTRLPDCVISDSYALDAEHYDVSLCYEYRFSYWFKNSNIEDYTHFQTITINNRLSHNYLTITLPISACNYMTDRTSDDMVIKCETYAKINESDTEFLAFIGYSYAYATVRIPEDVKPQILDFSIESYTTVPDLIIDSNTFVADISKINVKLKTWTAYGSEIVSYKVGLQPGHLDEQYWWQLPSFKDTKILLSGLIETPEEEAELMNRGVLTEVISRYYAFSNTIWATVTDSRGRTSDVVAIHFYVKDYYSPITGTLDAYRSDGNGMANESEAYVYCKFKIVIPETISIEDVTAYAILYVKETSGTLNYVERKTLSISAPIIEGNAIFNETDCFKDYKVELLISNGVENFRILRTIPSISTVIDIAPNGSIALGRIADDDNIVFEVNMAQKNYNNIIPSETGKFTLGNTDNRWQTIYTTGSPVFGSDARFKENISYVSNSNKTRTGAEISQEDLHSFYKSDYQLATYNYIGQEQQEYGFITQDMYDNSVGETLIIRNENGDMFSINSYVSSIAGALQYEINLRDEQIATLNQIILEMKQELENLKQGD